MSVIIGIDIGGSTTKIVGFRKKNGKNELIIPQLITASDPITSVYGAFGKFTDENGIALKEIDRIMMTGVGSSYVTRGLYGLQCHSVPEFRSIGLGGLYVSGLSSALVVSMGTGTALVHARENGDMTYLGGTGVGGGTVKGLSRLMLNAETWEHVVELAGCGNLANIDLRIMDLTADDGLPQLARDLTASNFGNVSDAATREDMAAGIVNMVLETVGMLSVFGARSVGVKDIVLTGNVSRLPLCEGKFRQFDGLYEAEGLRFIVPELSPFATVIGTALSGNAESRG